MRFVFVGFVAACLGYVLSPFTHVEDVIKVRPGLLLMWVIGVSSVSWVTFFVNGVNHRSFLKSWPDFTLNCIACSIMGCAVVLLVSYLLTFSVVGRWVFWLTVLTNVTINLVIELVHRRFWPNKIYLYGGEVDRFLKLVDLFVHPSKRSLYINKGGASIDDYISNFNRHALQSEMSYYFHGSEFGRIPLDRIQYMSSKVLETIRHIDSVVEFELEVVLIDSFKGEDVLNISDKVRGWSYRFTKRIFDLVCVTLLAVPAVLVIAFSGLIIMLCDSGSIFYTQTRLGQFGKSFKIIKLRTMITDAENGGAQWAKVNDARVTTVGRFLRKSRIDELPQLMNIFRGEMSFVGPRPERAEFYELLRDVLPEFDLRLACKPGLTGWAQINVPYGGNVDESRAKLHYDLFYIKHCGVFLDLRIVFRTVVAMMKGSR
jgi:lipopolysaccharide/colanic/teichoic acid biosynthesis glycosyltransferase